MTTSTTNLSTTFGELIAAEPALRRVSEQNGMSAKTVYRVAKLVRLVSAETAHFKAEQAKLFQELGTKREPRTPDERSKFGDTLLEIPVGQVAEFQKRLEELRAVPITIDWAPIRSTDLPSARAADLIDLGPLCELVEPEG